jgi:hypothetical protein
MKNEFYQSPEPTWLMKQFWKACGADAYLLQKSTYSDQIKYFCLGGIVVATGVMAAMAGGYAIYTIFEPKGNALDGLLTAKAVKSGLNSKELIHFPTLFISVLFGIIWGLIIYNIDRFIVTSTGKGDGTEAITGKEFRSAIPRIIMGLIIALTISKPIEIRMFKGEIDAKLSELQDTEYANRKKIIDANLESEVGKENKQIEKIDGERLKIEEKINDYGKRYADETTGITGPRGYGTEAKQMEKELNEWKGKLKEFDQLNKPELNKLKSNIGEVELRRKEKYEKAELEVHAMDGLLIRLKLAHEIAGWVISLFITLLFMVIELTPIFFKMMLIKGPYDYMDENVKELARAEAGIEIIYNFYEDGDGMEAHKVVNHNAELKYKERMLIVKAQEELNEQIVSAWKEKRKNQIKDNPEQFISED